jgi:hypothetical protein
MPAITEQTPVTLGRERGMLAKPFIQFMSLAVKLF